MVFYVLLSFRGQPPISLRQPPPPSSSPLNQESAHKMPRYVLRAILEEDVVHPSCDSPNTSRRFALGASNICLVGENPASSVQAQLGMRGSMVIRLRPSTIRVQPRPRPRPRPYSYASSGSNRGMFKFRLDRCDCYLTSSSQVHVDAGASCVFDQDHIGVRKGKKKKTRALR